MRIGCLDRPGRSRATCDRLAELDVVGHRSLPELLASSDVVSLHLPSSTETKNLVALQLVRASWPSLWSRLVSFQLDGQGERRPVALARPAPAAADFADYAEVAVAMALTDLRRRTGREWTPDELRNLRARDLDRSVGGGPNPSGMDFVLRAPRAANARAGVLTSDPVGRAGRGGRDDGEGPLRIAGTPRLFLSHRSIEEVSASGTADAFRAQCSTAATRSSSTATRGIPAGA
jgi:hypothetical protein